MMEHTAEHHDAHENLQWGRGRMAFMAHKDHIKELLAGGCPQLLIHKKMQETLGGLCYSQFSRLIRKYIFGVPKANCLAEPVSKPVQNRISNSEPTLPTVFRGFVPGPKVPDINDLF